MSESGSPSIVALAIADARSSVGFSRRDAVSCVEVLEHLEQRASLLFRGAALNLGVVAAEQFLGELEHPREVGLGNAEHRHDHVQRVVHRDLLDEVALHTGRQHLCRRIASPVRRREPSTPAWPSGGTSRRPIARITRCCGSSMWISVPCRPLGLCSSPSLVDQHRPRRVGEHVLCPLDRHDVGVLGDGPERLVVGHVDPRHRSVGPQMGQRAHAVSSRRYTPAGRRAPWRLVHDRRSHSAPHWWLAHSFSTAMTVLRERGGKPDQDAVDDAVAPVTDLGSPAFERSDHRERVEDLVVDERTHRVPFALRDLAVRLVCRVSPAVQIEHLSSGPVFTIERDLLAGAEGGGSQLVLRTPRHDEQRTRQLEYRAAGRTRIPRISAGVVLSSK